ncbi:MAG TPA: hypothetical protein ENH10_03755 [Bacteroidetes bacterium]|nr:hypothetical protein [Bacteroidota bacterium]HEX04257.1 hypothetical protein [Bacteroidota bacterium]
MHHAHDIYVVDYPTMNMPLLPLTAITGLIRNYKVPVDFLRTQNCRLIIPANRQKDGGSQGHVK